MKTFTRSIIFTIDNKGKVLKTSRTIFSPVIEMERGQVLRITDDSVSVVNEDGRVVKIYKEKQCTKNT